MLRRIAEVLLSKPVPPGYLTEVEASHLETQALPGAIVLQLKRHFPNETVGGRPVRRMFIELTVGEAVQHWQAMGEMIRRAGALVQQASSADSATNL